MPVLISSDRGRFERAAPTLASPSTPPSVMGRLAPAALLAVVVVLAYANSFPVPFLFDDQSSVVDNPTIRHGAWEALSPPRGKGITVEGRPILNLSLAIDYAFGGTSVWIYHATNLAIHFFCALTLCAIVRRTLLLPPIAAQISAAATPIALLVAGLWASHPLQTESVTYVVQRAESLMGFFYLFVLYAFLRGATGPHRPRWFALALLAGALGMATKEVMVTAPVIVFLFDRTLISGSFREAWRRHGRWHVTLASTWLVLGWLVLGAGDRGGTIGEAAGVTWWQYAFCQSRAVIHYLGLALWPHPLVFDYGSDFVSFGEIAPHLALDLALVGLTWFALWRWPAAGLLGACFFLILAPTTSVVGGTRQMLAEHRMYLSLGAVIMLAVIGLHGALGRRALVAAGAAAMALGLATLARNSDYRTELALYADTVAKRPNNAYARYNFGKVLAERGQLEAAVVQDREAIRLRPTMAGAHNNLGKALSDLGHRDAAVPSYQAALELAPDYALAHANLGIALVGLGRKAEALPHFRAAVQLEPRNVAARDNWGSVLLDLGETAAAEEQFRQVLELDPNLVEARCNLGTVLLLQGKFPAAAEQFEAALQLNPQLAVARERLALARQRIGLPDARSP